MLNPNKLTRKPKPNTKRIIVYSGRIYNSTEAFWLVYFPSYILQKIIIAQMLSIGGEGKIVYWPRHPQYLVYNSVYLCVSSHEKGPNTAV